MLKFLYTTACVIYDSDTGVHVYMAPLTSFAVGYRHIYLSKDVGNMMIPPPSLFVHVAVSDIAVYTLQLR